MMVPCWTPNTPLLLLLFTHTTYLSGHAGVKVTHKETSADYRTMELHLVIMTCVLLSRAVLAQDTHSMCGEALGRLQPVCTRDVYYDCRIVLLLLTVGET